MTNRDESVKKKLSRKAFRKLARKRLAPKRRLTATRIRINRQGYDSRGKYWGVGAPLYRVCEGDEMDVMVRAPSAERAKAEVYKLFGNTTRS